MYTAKHVIFTGRVQGVGFRFTTLNIAGRYDLTGYVKNCPDGAVEMLAQGSPQDIDDAIADISESFPGYVRETKITEVPTDPKYTEFKITF
jgi:acylphosphatase